MSWHGLLAFLLLAPLLAVEGQNPSLTVFVRENNSSGKPLANVQISVSGGNSAKTATDGKKKLSFPGREIGDVLTLGIHLEGYEVVSPLPLTVTLPKSPTTELHLYLCRPDRCGEVRLKAAGTSQIELNKKIEARYRTEIEDLKIQGKNTAEELAYTKGKLDQARDIIAWQFVEPPQPEPAEGSAMHRLALQLFLDGKLDEAQSELDPAKLKEELGLIRADQEAAAKALESLAQSYVLRGQIFAAQLQFDASNNAFLDAAAISPDNLDAAYYVALIHQRGNRFEEALLEYQRAVKLARAHGNSEKLALLLNSLGNLHHALNRLGKARDAYQEALGIYRQLAEKDPDVYLPKVATALNNLGFVYRDQNRTAEARKAFQEALAAYRQLAGKKPDVFLPGLVQALENLADFEVQSPNFAAALPLRIDELAARRTLSMLRSPGDGSVLARSAGRLALAYMQAGQPGNAATAAREALSLIGSLDPLERQDLEELISQLQSIAGPGSANP